MDSRAMRCSLVIFSTILAFAFANGSSKFNTAEANAFNINEDLFEQIDRLKHNVTELWENFSALKRVLTETLNHLRVHQSELEETVHMLEHKHDGSEGSHGSYTDDHHHHSGEQHSHEDGHSHDGSSHSHGSNDHHHSGEHHSHSGEQHSHDDDHSHSGEQHSHDHDHYHQSWSHSHSSSPSGASHHQGHDDHHQHESAPHETNDDLQQSVQGVEPVVEPLVMPSSAQQHYHHNQPQQPSQGLANTLQLITDSRFNSHHHHHRHHSHGKNERNRTVEIPKYSDYSLYDFAVCNVVPNRAIPEDEQQEVMGRINLWQKKSGGPLNFHVRLQGFDMGDHHDHHGMQQAMQQEEDSTTPATVVHKHGFHIHASGDLSNGCNSAGGHYNPKDVNHGGPNALVRHVGDLGKIECDEHGNANIVFNDDIATLKGTYSVVGKAIVIHANEDDLGNGGDEESLRTGNSGARIACCVIERVEKLPIRAYKFMKTATTYQNR